MKVKELIQLNNYIGDIEVTVRGGYNGCTRIKSWHIGVSEGVFPQYPLGNATYINASINAYDDGKDERKLSLKNIPKEVLELEVTAWDSYPAHRLFNNHNLECVRITAKENASGQMSIEELEKSSDGKPLL